MSAPQFSAKQPAGDETKTGTDSIAPFRTIALLLPILAAVGSGVLVAFSGNSGVFQNVTGTSTFALPVQSFYGVVAAIVPLLLIAFAVEKRAVDFLPGGRFRGLLWLFLLLGESFALIGASGVFRESPVTVDLATPPSYHEGASGYTFNGTTSDAQMSTQATAAADQVASFDFQDGGYVAGSVPLTNVIAGGAVGGLVGGFVMITMLAVGLPKWWYHVQPVSSQSDTMPPSTPDMEKAQSGQESTHTAAAAPQPKSIADEPSATPAGSAQTHEAREALGDDAEESGRLKRPDVSGQAPPQPKTGQHLSAMDQE